MIRQRRREMRLEPSSLCAIPSEMAARQADVRACGSVRAGRLRQRRQRRRRRDPPPLSSGRVSLRPSSRAQLQMQTLLNAVSPSAEQPRLDKEGVGVEGSQVDRPPGYDEHCCARDRGTPACDRGSCRHCSARPPFSRHAEQCTHWAEQAVALKIIASWAPDASTATASLAQRAQHDPACGVCFQPPTECGRPQSAAPSSDVLSVCL